MPLPAGGGKWGSGKRRRHSLCNPTISHNRPSRVSGRNNTFWAKRITGAHLPQQCRLVTWAIQMTSRRGGDHFRRWLICQSYHGSKGTGFESRHDHPLWPAQEHIQRVELKDSRSSGCKRFGVQRQSSVQSRGQVRSHFVVSLIPAFLPNVQIGAKVETVPKVGDTLLMLVTLTTWSLRSADDRVLHVGEQKRLAVIVTISSIELTSSFFEFAYCFLFARCNIAALDWGKWTLNCATSCDKERTCHGSEKLIFSQS